MKRKTRIQDWIWQLFDRLIYVIVSAGIAAFLAWMQGDKEITKLKGDVKNLEWGVDYFRSNN